MPLFGIGDIALGRGIECQYGTFLGRGNDDERCSRLMYNHIARIAEGGFRYSLPLV